MKARLFVTGVTVEVLDVSTGWTKNYAAGHTRVHALDERGDSTTWTETVDPTILGTWIEREVEPATWKVVGR